MLFKYHIIYKTNEMFSGISDTCILALHWIDVDGDWV